MDLEERLSYQFKRKELLKRALTHRSYGRERGGEDNERLEFLGDAVLELVVTELLMERFPELSEGELSYRRAMLVNKEGLFQVARSLGLGEYLLLGKGEELSGGRRKKSILAGALEAVVASLYLDGGLEEARRFVSRHLFSLLSQAEVDPKGLLQKHCQRTLGLLPLYRLVERKGPPHAPLFQVELKVGGLVVRAWGGGRKEAEKRAAEEALRRTFSL